MRIKPSSTLLGSLLAALLVSLCGQVWANLIVYQDYMAFQSIQIGGTAHTCSSVSDPGCAFIAITAEGDTSTVTPFNVPGASGFKNSLTSASISVFFNDGSPAYFADIDLSVGGLYVSVDQTNAGAGFGSMFGPTYPLATYDGAPYTTYDLASNFSSAGFGPFCPDLNLCTNGAALRTVGGTEFIITAGLGPAYSSFSSTVTPTIPEPGSAWLVALSVVALGAVRAARARAG